MIHYSDKHLHVNSHKLADIIHTIPTPFYFYDATRIQHNIARYIEAFDTIKLPYHVHYAVKANSNIHVLKLINSLNIGMDVVSQGEIMRCLKANVPSRDIVFSGVGKQQHEIIYALQHDIGQFNVESASEIDDIIAACAITNHKARIALRINPDIAPKTHAKISTGKKGDKFGIAYDDIVSLVRHIVAHDCLDFQGLAMHIGSQITTLDAFHQAYQRLRDLVLAVNPISPCFILDIGGGIGIHYADDDKLNFNMADYAVMVQQYFGDLGAVIMLEPGRSIVGDAGYLVSNVIRVKHADNKQITIIDAAMNDLIRPTLYNGYHAVYPLYQHHDNIMQDYVGPICETGDYLLLQDYGIKVDKGDTLLFANSGAYGAVMASSYNSRPIIAEYMLDNNGIMSLIRRSVSVETMLEWEQQ